MSENPSQHQNATQTGVTSAQKYTYAILQETSGEEMEAWLYFIRYQGNEEALQHLQKQLEQVRWEIVDDNSTFDLELDYLVSEQTAKEMTLVDLNAYSFHRKFDGVLQKIDLGFKDGMKNVKKMARAFKVLGYGKIDEFIDKEDIDPQYLRGSQDESEDSSSDSEEESEEESSEDSTSSLEEESSKSSKKKHRRSRGERSRHKVKHGSKPESKLPEVSKAESSKSKLPPLSAKAAALPGFAKAKAKRRH